MGPYLLALGLPLTWEEEGELGVEEVLQQVLLLEGLPWVAWEVGPLVGGQVAPAGLGASSPGLVLLAPLPLEGEAYEEVEGAFWEGVADYAALAAFHPPVALLSHPLWDLKGSPSLEELGAEEVLLPP